MMTNQNHESELDSLSLIGHLDELRGRFIKILILFVLAAVCVYGSFDVVYEIISAPVGALVFLSPQDAFVARLMLTWSLALCIISPYIIFHVWSFVKLGLRPKEIKSMVFFVPVSFCFLIAGGCFAYFVMIPILLKFLLGFKAPNMIAMITVGNYLRFFFLLIFSFSILFQLPIVLLCLTKAGLVTPQQLSKKRRHAFISMLILGAMLTPPDVVTQFVVAVPLFALFELGILFSRLVCQGDR